jgi:NAD-dependent SIR2 family protein deacetylase
MASVVFILGAGASQQAGAPLMADFLDRADDLWKSGLAGEKAHHFEKVFRAIGALQPVHSKAELDLTNIESIFSILDVARTLGKLPGFEPSDVSEITSSLKELIVVTLEQTILFPFSTSRSSPDPPPPYPEFLSLIKYLKAIAMPPQTVSIITFNYDMAIDYALHLERLGPDYCLSDSSTGGLPLLKLHGSLNWAFCAKCSSVVAWHLDQYCGKYPWSGFLPHGAGPGKYVPLTIGSSLGSFEHCGQAVVPEPVLVPPTWNKTEHHEALSQVWRRAAKELEKAERIFIIGYSLPSTDTFFRLLYALGTVSEKTLKQIWVYNPAKEPDVRFSSMLGPGAKARYQYHLLTFDDAIDHIGERFRKPAPPTPGLFFAGGRTIE